MLCLTLIYYLELHSFLWPFSFLPLCSLSCSPWGMPFIVLLTMLSSFLWCLFVSSYFSPEIWPLMFCLLTHWSSLSQVLIFLLNSLFVEVMASCGFFFFFSNVVKCLSQFYSIWWKHFSGKCSPFVRKFWCTFTPFILRVTLHWFSTCSSFP